MKHLTTAAALLAALGAIGACTLPGMGTAASTLHAISEWDATRPAEPDLSTPAGDGTATQGSPALPVPRQA